MPFGEIAGGKKPRNSDLIFEPSLQSFSRRFCCAAELSAAPRYVRRQTPPPLLSSPPPLCRHRSLRCCLFSDAARHSDRFGAGAGAGPSFVMPIVFTLRLSFSSLCRTRRTPPSSPLYSPLCSSPLLLSASSLRRTASSPLFDLSRLSFAMAPLFAVYQIPLLSCRSAPLSTPRLIAAPLLIALSPARYACANVLRHYLCVACECALCGFVLDPLVHVSSPAPRVP